MSRLHRHLRRGWPYIALFALWCVTLFVLTDGLPDTVKWVADWMRWDSEWYQKIWQHGYIEAEPGTLVFPPGYSALIGGFSVITRINFELVALIVNVISFFAAAVVASEVLGKKFELSPYVLFALILSTPTAYFAFAGYSDSVFMLMMWIALAIATKSVRHKLDWVWEALLLLVLPWMRITGYAFAIWIWLRRWTALTVLFSLAGWLALNFWLKGNAFYFLEAQKLMIMAPGTIVTGFRYAFDGLRFHPVPLADFDVENYLNFHLLPIFYLALLVGASVWLLRKKHALFALTCLSILLISHNQSFWRSTLRYDLPILPFAYAMFLCAFMRGRSESMVLRRGILVGVFTAFQFVLQIYLARLFHSGRWAF
jgi:hypothetical protein